MFNLLFNIKMFFFLSSFSIIKYYYLISGFILIEFNQNFDYFSVVCNHYYCIFYLAHVVFIYASVLIKYEMYFPTQQLNHFIIIYLSFKITKVLFIIYVSYFNDDKIK